MLSLEANEALLEVMVLKLDTLILLFKRLLLLPELVTFAVKAALVALELLEIGVETTVVLSEDIGLGSGALNLGFELTA